MKTKVSVFIATSLDGFIAREDGKLDWLLGSGEDAPTLENKLTEDKKKDTAQPGEEAETGDDMGFYAFFSTVDTLIMGRNSFEKVLSFGQWYYEDMPVIVLSSNPSKIKGEWRETVSFSSLTPEELVADLGKQGRKHLYIDGGNTIQRFLKARLVDEIIITKVPVLIGKGIPLFADIGFDVQLEHLKTVAYDKGFVQSHYKVIKS